MIPIFEQGDGKGIGLLLKNFESRFQKICAEHIETGRAKSFAFIFYDFTDGAIRKILKDRGVFAQLDRLSGKDLSIFYLHTASRQAVEKFNEIFLEKIGLPEPVSLPCVVFFRLSGSAINDVAVVQLDSPNEIHGFHELYSVVKSYLDKDSRRPGIKWLKGKTDEVSTNLFSEGLFKFLEHIL